MTTTKLSPIEYLASKPDALLDEFYSICRTIDMEATGVDPSAITEVKKYDAIADEYIWRTCNASCFSVLSASGKRALHGFSSIVRVGMSSQEVAEYKAQLMEQAESNTSSQF